MHIARVWIDTGYAESVESVADLALRLYALVETQVTVRLPRCRTEGQPRAATSIT